MSAHIWKPYTGRGLQAGENFSFCCGCGRFAMNSNRPDAPCLSPATAEESDAAALQCWLVGNARHLRPAFSTGLTSWALAALQGFSMEELRK